MGLRSSRCVIVFTVAIGAEWRCLALRRIVPLSFLSHSLGIPKAQPSLEAHPFLAVRLGLPLTTNWFPWQPRECSRRLRVAFLWHSRCLSQLMSVSRKSYACAAADTRPRQIVASSSSLQINGGMA